MFVLPSFSQDHPSPARKPVESERPRLQMTPAMTMGIGILAMAIISLCYLAG